MNCVFILIETSPAKEREVYEALLKVPGVVRVQPLFGEWDIIVEGQANNMEGIGALVDTIEKIPEVTDTKPVIGNTSG